MIPRRTADTMSDAIALSSPNGRMSKRSKADALRRLSVALFGPNGEAWKQPEPTEQERALARADTLRRSAANLRELAARGMKPLAYPKRAAEMEAEADRILAALK